MSKKKIAKLNPLGGSVTTPINTLDALLRELKKKSLRTTGPRKMILEALFENHGPFAAEEIHKKFIRSSCDLATVYRCLVSLEQAKLLRRCEFGDGVTRYELIDHHPSQQHHHHLICTECKKIEIVEECEIENHIGQFAKKHGFSSVSHMLEFFGVCPACQAA